VDAEGREQGSRPGASPSSRQFVASVAIHLFLEDTALLFKCFKTVQVPRLPPFLSPTTIIPLSFRVELCRRETRKMTRKRLVSSNYLKVKTMSMKNIYSGRLSATGTCRLISPRLSTGYGFSFLSWCWLLTVLYVAACLASFGVDRFRLFCAGFRTSGTVHLASHSEQTDLFPPVSNNICTGPRSPFSASTGRGARFWCCTSGRGRCCSPARGAKGKPSTKI
jgi:hypothetical protein